MIVAREGAVESGGFKLHFKNAVRIVGNIFLGFLTAGLLCTGITYIFIPSLVNSGTRSPLLGSMFLVVAITILIWKMDRWVTALPAILGYGAFGGMLAVVSGHLDNQPSKLISRSDAAIFTGFLIAAAAISSTFGKRTLSLLDRAALLAFVISIPFSAFPNRSVMFLTLCAGLIFLLFAWAYHRIAGAAD